MATLSQQAAAASDKEALDEARTAFEIADLTSDTPLDMASFLAQRQREKERARKGDAVKKAMQSGPQVHPPPFNVPRSFELEAISATYTPKAVRKIIIPRPKKNSQQAGRQPSPQATPQLSPQGQSQPTHAPDSDAVILHGLYQLQPAVHPYLTGDEQHLRQVIEQNLSRLCPPYGLRSLLEMFTGSMFHSATPLLPAGDNPHSPLLSGLQRPSLAGNLNASMRLVAAASPNSSFAPHLALSPSSDIPTASTIGKGGHWDSATNLRAHMERMEGHVIKLRSGLKELFDNFGDEPLFGPVIGFELNHAIVLWGHCKERLLARRKMAEFRDRKEFLSDKISRGTEGGKQLATAASPTVVAASATLARYDGILGALDYICKNLLPQTQFTNQAVVPLTLHYAIARAAANAQSAVNANASMATNLNASFNFNPNASFRKAGSPSFGAPNSGGTLIPSLDNAYKVSHLVSALLTALEVFRFEFDIIDESLLTITAIEAAIRIAVEWLKGAS